MSEDIKFKLLEYGWAFVVAPLAFMLMQWGKRFSAWLDTQTAWIKRGIVTVVVTAFVAAGNYLGVDFGAVAGTDSIDFLGNIDVQTIKVALGAGMAMLIHYLKNGRTAKK